MNKAFVTETKMRLTDLKNQAVRILQHKINNIQMSAAFTQVFAGETSFVEDLESPFSMFSGITWESTPESGRFNKAVIFPVPANGSDEITHGVIVLLP